MGHAGTLDPLATGLMLIGVGRGTKRLGELTKLDKEYFAEVRFGERRTTGDLEGEIVESCVIDEDIEQVRERVDTALNDLHGEVSLPVSAYSAIKVDGVPMYKRARNAEIRGEMVVDVPIRTMRVHEVELFDLSVKDERVVAAVRFVVGSGTYIRSLAEELGRRIGYPATLQNLRRTRVGGFLVENAYQLPGLETE